MILKKTQIKQTAIFLTLVYFLASSHVYMMIGMGRHALEHVHHASHVAHHASSICAWMCALAAAHSTNTEFSQSFHLSFENRLVYSEPVFNDPTVFSFYIRPPPVTLS